MECWEAQLDECLAQSSILQQGSFRCWLDGRKLPEMNDEVADALREEGPRGRHLSCAAAVHLALPEEGLTLQVPVPANVTTMAVSASAACARLSVIPSRTNTSAQAGYVAAWQVGEQDAGRAGEDAAVRPVVTHLPPLVLRAAFPAGYPERQPPAARLSASWLAPTQGAALQQRLSQLWEEQGPGGPILYTWIDWLESSALQELGIASLLTLPEQPEELGIDAAEQLSTDAPEQLAIGPSGAAVQLGEEDRERPSLEQSNAERARSGEQACSSSSSSSSSDEDAEASMPSSWEAAAGAKESGGLPWADALLARLLRYNAMREADIFRQVCLSEEHPLQDDPNCRSVEHACPSLLHHQQR
jgi:hypothetical protein